MGCSRGPLARLMGAMLLGGLAARTPLGDLGLVDVNQAQLWQDEACSRLGRDLLWQLELSQGPGQSS